MNRGGLVAAGVVVAVLALGAAALAATGKLTPKGCIDAEPPAGADNCSQSAEGLEGPVALAVSPDGRSVYAATDDDAVVRFKRRPASGTLTPAGCIADHDTGAGICGDHTAGLEAPDGVAVSPDGRSVYVVSGSDDAIVTFKRKKKTGALTPAGCVDDEDFGSDLCTTETSGLYGADDVAVSPDGKSVYVVSANDSAIVRFKRNTTTGGLTPAGCVDDNSGQDDCNQTVASIAGPISLAISPDGRSLYVAGSQDDSIARFKRSKVTGALTPAGCVEDNGTGTGGCKQHAKGLDIPVSVTVSSNGKSVYAGAGGDNAIVSFKRNKVTGKLTSATCIDDDDSGVDDCAKSTDGLDDTELVAVSPDGRSVYVTAFGDQAIVSFKRNGATGRLTPAGCIEDNDFGPDDCARHTDGLRNVIGLALSRDGRSVYVASRSDDAVTVFRRAR